jgi:hypothetical protein
VVAWVAGLAGSSSSRRNRISLIFWHAIWRTSIQHEQIPRCAVQRSRDARVSVATCVYFTAEIFQMREEFQILTFVQDGLITGPGGAPVGRSGFSINCPIVQRLD